MNGRERLAVLADALEANAANPTGMKFSLENWFAPKHMGLPEINCGTVGCAVGLACLLPALQAEGLGMYRNAMGSMNPKFNGATNWVAVDVFFGLDYDMSRRLFDYDEYRHDGPTEGAEAELRVAKRIRDYLAK